MSYLGHIQPNCSPLINLNEACLATQEAPAKKRGVKQHNVNRQGWTIKYGGLCNANTVFLCLLCTLLCDNISEYYKLLCGVLVSDKLSDPLICYSNWTSWTIFSLVPEAAHVHAAACSQCLLSASALL